MHLWLNLKAPYEPDMINFVDAIQCDSEVYHPQLNMPKHSLDSGAIVGHPGPSPCPKMQLQAAKDKSIRIPGVEPGSFRLVRPLVSQVQVTCDF